MYDLSQPNSKPGKCRKCQGTGEYRWGAVVNGKTTHSGPCHSCGGTGKQTMADIKRNEAYNRHKIAAILSYDTEPDYGGAFDGVNTVYSDADSGL